MTQEEMQMVADLAAAKGLLCEWYDTTTLLLKAPFRANYCVVTHLLSLDAAMERLDRMPGAAP